MNDQQPIALFPTPQARQPGHVYFRRWELMKILNVYGRMVAAGHWKDYAISSTPDAAVFSVYRRTSEMPLYRIYKRPRLASKQGAYAVLGFDGRVLKRGHSLESALTVFERKFLKVVD